MLFGSILTGSKFFLLFYRGEDRFSLSFAQFRQFIQLIFDGTDLHLV